MPSLKEKTASERFVDAYHRSLPKCHPERLERARRLRQQRAFSVVRRRAAGRTRALQMDDITELALELANQWEYNHAEHCGHIWGTYPHAGVCHWPMPAGLAKHWERIKPISLDKGTVMDTQEPVI